MKKSELNRDIKRLKKTALSSDMTDVVIFNELKKEFLRLYYADNGFIYMNRNSVLIMFRLNQVNRFQDHSVFGCGIDIKSL